MTTRKIITTSMIAGIAIGMAVVPRPGAPQGAPDFSQVFTRSEFMIPMRDGVRLHTEVCVPKNPAGALPFLITRTPYGVNDDSQGFSRTLGTYRELIPEGYIFVFQDIRGRFQSEGRFVMQRPPRDRSDPKSIDEGTDTFDTVDWLIRNIPNHNGRAGLLGISYGGWLTTMALLEPHPALKAASEQASPADMFLGDDFHHNGAFRLSYGFEYAVRMESARDHAPFRFDRYDTYEWYLSLGPLSNVNERYLHGQIPSWNDFVAHPNRDSFWQSQAFDAYLHKTAVPNLNVGGWWDQEDFYGPFKIYELLEANDRDHLNYIVSGPWNHGGWWRQGDRLGPIEFGSDTAKYFRAKIQAPWFAYWLHDKGPLQQPEALMFETGSNEWKSYDAWPPKKGVTPRKLYLRAHRGLSFDPPAERGDNASDSYVSAPANPVPYRQRPITATYPASDWPVWLVQDQRFVDHRPDVLSWETGPLNQDLTVTGEITADLFASSSGSDADWIVKLIDVYPEDYATPALRGYQLMIADEVFRGRFRNSFEEPSAIPSGKVLEYRFSLHSNDHTFKKGHKVMVQVQSTWFPLIDRNPQTFVPNIFMARPADYRKATQRIYRSRQAPSGMILPVAAP